MNTFNFYNFHHKAIRNLLGQLNVKFGKTDFENQNEIDSLKMSLLKLMSLLASHSYIEDNVILTAVTSKGVSIPENLNHDHNRLDSIIFKIISAFQTLSSTTPEVKEKGSQLYLLFNQFHGEFLLHMHLEEVDMLPILQEHLNVEETEIVKQQMVNKTPHKLILDWFLYGLPALSYQNQIELLQPVISNYSAEMMSGVLSVAKKSLPEIEFNKLIAGLNLKVV